MSVMASIYLTKLQRKETINARLAQLSRESTIDPKRRSIASVLHQDTVPRLKLDYVNGIQNAPFHLNNVTIGSATSLLLSAASPD